MEQLPYVKRFQDLLAYTLARELAQEIFDLSREFPREERYSLTDQIRRSSRSVGAQIAEAWGKRRYKRHFISKLTDADGEQLETQHWLLSALDCRYIKRNKYKELMRKSIRIGKLLGGMIGKADVFCGEMPTVIRESAPEYFVNENDLGQDKILFEA